MANYEVAYEYIVAGIRQIEAEGPAEAEALVEAEVKTAEPACIEFEVASVRLVDGN